MKKVCLLALLSLAVLVPFNDAFAQCGTTPITGDLVITADQPLSGTYNVSGLFRVDPGVVCSVTPYTNGGCGELIINAVDIEIIGDIIGDGSGFTGGTGGTGGTTGNNVAALNGCISTGSCVTVDVNGGLAGTAGAGPGAGTPGVAGTLGLGPKQECQTIGDDYGFVGGAGGGGSAGGGSYGGLANAGGLGGNGGAYNPSLFSDIDIAGCATPQAGTGGAGGGVGASYGTVTGLDIDLGSGGAGGGGGGKSAGNGVTGTSGGAGGGLVVLNASGNLTVAGNVSVNGNTGTLAGGFGGDGGVSPDCCNENCADCGERTFSSGAGGGGGSGGGSGGGILLQGFGVMNITGTLRSIGGNGTTGGAGGVGSSCSYSGGIFECGLPTSNSGSTNPGASGELGGGGSGGRIKIFQNPCQANNINASVLISGGNGFGGSAGDGSYHLGDLGNFTAPTLTASSDSVSCFGLADGAASVTVNGGTAPFTYSWLPTGGNAASASNLAAGSYDIMVTDSNGCMVTETVVVSQPDTLTATIFGQIDPDCFGANTGEASVMGFGGTEPYTYLWDDPNAQTTETATGLPAGDWVVEVTDVNGCMATDTVMFLNSDPFAGSIDVDQNVTCFGETNGQATVVANGTNLTYQWDDPLLQQTATASNLPAGTWNVTVASSQTCDTTYTVVVTEPDVLVVAASEDSQVSCNGGADGVAIAAVTGGTMPYSYQWDDPNSITTATANLLAAGIYNVVVTDANQCTATTSVTITEASAIAIALNIDSASCNGLSDAQVEAIVSGGTPTYTYEWSPGAITGNPLTGIPAGSYSLTVTDANSCTATFQNVLVPEPLEIQLSLVQSVDVSCNGAADGFIEVAAVNGTPSYTYLWDDPNAQTTATAQNLGPGTYSLTVTDANGCTADWLNEEITEPDSLVVTVTSTTPITCDYSEDGMAETEVVGGTPAYNYVWSDANGQTGGTAIDLAAGDYTVTVTDANGCIATANATINPPINELTAGFSISPETGDQPLPITVTNTSVGGTAFEWNFGDGNTITTFDTSSFEYLYADSGAFTVYLIAYNDVTGCSDTLVLENAVYINPTSELVVPNVITPNGDGINDMFPIDPVENDFFPFLIRNIYDFKGEVFNRWGEKVYQWTQPLAGWDGRTTSGIVLNGGTYYYVITAKGVDGDAVTDYEIKGAVTLIK